MLLYRLRLLVCLLFLFPLVLQAQNEAKIKAELSTFLQNFASDYEALPKTKNKQKVLKYFAPDATYTIYSHTIAGRARVQNFTIKDFAGYLESIVQASDITLGYDVGEQYFTYIGEDLATFSYSVRYETKEEAGIWVKGDETVTMAVIKEGDHWEVVHFTIVQIEDEKLKGTCLCELFIAEADNAEVVAKTTIPSGKSYSTRFDNFEFRPLENGNQIIRVNGKVFKQLPSGELFEVVDGEETEIAISNSKRETVLSIIAQSLYKDSCARLKAKTR